MKISAEEQAAINTICDLGGRFGYGNLISHLQSAWADSLMHQYEMTEKQALREGGYLVAMHKDLREHGEWDEAGKKYAKKAKR